MRASGALAGVASAFCLVFPGSAAAQVLPSPINVTVTPAAPVYPQESQVTWRVEMTTGADPVAVGMFWFGPGWPGGREFEGGPLRFGEPILEGPGEIREPRRFGIGIPLYGIFAACQKGNVRARTADGDAREIHIPANATTTLAIPAQLTSPPLTVVDYTADIEMFPIQASDGDPLAYGGQLVTPRVAWGGTPGVYIQMRLRKADRKSAYEGTRRSPRMFGSTTPPVRNRPIKLRAVKPNGDPILDEVSLADWKRARKLGLGRTDASGRFTVKPRRLPPGTYRVLARYGGGQLGVAPDWNCGPLFRIARPSDQDG